MISFESKKEDVSTLLKNGDFHLGFRKLVDCVLDTQDLANYRKCIAFTEWKESEERNADDFKEKALAFLQTLKLENPPEMNSKPLLKAVGVRKEYARGRFKLGDVDMTISPGDIWGLVGENGNGKTTLLRLLCQDLSFDQGTISYSDLDTTDTYSLRTRLTYLPQRTPKWYGSLKSNLKYAASHYGTTGEENELLVMMYIIRFGLWNYRSHQWSELSSGYKMRFELARTFLRKPTILLLDEPLANLDVLAQQLILEDLKNMSQSLAHPLGIVLSSQQLFEVEKVSDKLLFLKNGAPTHLATANDEQTEELTVLEMDVQASKEELMLILQKFPETSISFNGGMYIVRTQKNSALNAIVQELITHGITIKYLRDITHSSRRLFV